MFKDKNINRRNKKDYRANLSEFAQAIQKGDQALADLLFGGVQLEAHKYAPDHSRCTYVEKPLPPDKKPRVTEKRICRCMYFYGKMAHCSSCSFPAKRGNGTPEFELSDYEQPTWYLADNVGGIDLVWTWHGETYAVEVKPPNSTETLIRMVAEILTYNWQNPKNYKPAICFFQHNSEGKVSKQWREYLDWKNDPDFQTMIGKVHVFYITVDEGRFYIRHIRDEESEPLCE